MVEYCISWRNLEVDERDGNSRTPLFYAVLSLQTEAVDYLLSHRADPNASDVVGERPLHVAGACRSEAVVFLLLAASADPCVIAKRESSPENGKNPRSILDEDHQLDNYQYDETRSNKNYASGGPLHFAAKYGYGQNTKLLLGKARGSIRLTCKEILPCTEPMTQSQLGFCWRLK